MREVPLNARGMWVVPGPGAKPLLCGHQVIARANGGSTLGSRGSCLSCGLHRDPDEVCDTTISATVEEVHAAAVVGARNLQRIANQYGQLLIALISQGHPYHRAGEGQQCPNGHRLFESHGWYETLRCAVCLFQTDYPIEVAGDIASFDQVKQEGIIPIRLWLEVRSEALGQVPSFLHLV